MLQHNKSVVNFLAWACASLVLIAGTSALLSTPSNIGFITQQVFNPSWGRTYNPTQLSNNTNQGPWTPPSGNPSWGNQNNGWSQVPPPWGTVNTLKSQLSMLFGMMRPIAQQNKQQSAYCDVYGNVATPNEPGKIDFWANSSPQWSTLLCGLIDTANKQLIDISNLWTNNLYESFDKLTAWTYDIICLTWNGSPTTAWLCQSRGSFIIDGNTNTPVSPQPWGQIDLSIDWSVTMQPSRWWRQNGYQYDLVVYNDQWLTQNSVVKAYPSKNLHIRSTNPVWVFSGGIYTWTIPQLDAGKDFKIQINGYSNNGTTAELSAELCNYVNDIDSTECNANGNNTIPEDDEIQL